MSNNTNKESGLELLDLIEKCKAAWKKWYDVEKAGRHQPETVDAFDEFFQAKKALSNALSVCLTGEAKDLVLVPSTSWDDHIEAFWQQRKGN